MIPSSNGRFVPVLSITLSWVASLYVEAVCYCGDMVAAL